MRIVHEDLSEQALTAPRLLPRYFAGNVWGYNSPRALRNYGGPHWGGEGSDIVPPLSRAEFKSHFLLGSEKITEVLAELRFPRSPGRPADKDFAYMHDSNGEPIRWVSQETAFLVFLKRMRTRGSVAIQLQSFFGRSVGWISQVFNAVLNFLYTRWVPSKILSLDSNVFSYWRLQDYATCLKKAGLGIPGCVGFVDGTFHGIHRPGRDGYQGLLQRLFYNGAHKGHGIIFEMITFPDGLIGRAYGPVSGRHHDLYLARKSQLKELLVTGALKYFRLFGDKAYLGFGSRIMHPFLAPTPGSYEAWFNTHTSAYRIEVEHNIGNIYMQCAVLQNEMNLERQLPEAWFLTAVFIHNIHTCVYSNNQTALRFGMNQFVPSPLPLLI